MKSNLKTIAAASIFSIVSIGCGKINILKNENISTASTEATKEQSFSSLLGNNLEKALVKNGVSASQSKTLVEKGSAKSSEQALSLSLADDATAKSNTMGDVASGFVQGCVEALDEAGIKDEKQQLVILRLVVEETSKSLVGVKLDKGETLESFPAQIAGAAMEGLAKSGLKGDSLEAAAGRITESAMNGMTLAKVPTDKMESASSQLMKSAVENIEKLKITPEKVSKVAQAAMNGAIGGIAKSTQIAQVELMMKSMTQEVAGGLKKAGLTEDQMVIAMGDVAKSSTNALSKSNVGQENWAKLSESLNNGLVAGLKEMKLNEEKLGASVKNISQGSVEGVGQLQEKLPADQKMPEATMTDMMKRSSAGTVAGLSRLNIEEAKVNNMVKVASDGSSAGLLNIPSMTNEMRTKSFENLSAGAIAGLSDRKMTEEKLAEIRATVQASSAAAIVKNPGTLDTAKIAEAIQKGFEAGAIDALLRQQEAILNAQRLSEAEKAKQLAAQKLTLEANQAAFLAEEKAKADAALAERQRTLAISNFEADSAIKLAAFNSKPSTEKKLFCVAWKAMPIPPVTLISSASYVILKTQCDAAIAASDSPGAGSSGTSNTVPPTAAPTAMPTVTPGSNPVPNNDSVLSTQAIAALNLLMANPAGDFVSTTSPNNPDFKMIYCRELYKLGGYLPVSNGHISNLMRCAEGSTVAGSVANPVSVIPTLDGLLGLSASTTSTYNLLTAEKKISYCKSLSFVTSFVTPNNQLHFGNKSLCNPIVP